MYDWKEFLQLANDWANQKGEGIKRCAISRAYYSVYRQANNYLEDRHLAPALKADSHDAVWRSFAKLGQSGVSISISGDRLKRYRVKADYPDEIQNIGADTKLAIRIANELDSQLSQLP